jgi:hypothetical protein
MLPETKGDLATWLCVALRTFMLLMGHVKVLRSWIEYNSQVTIWRTGKGRCTKGGSGQIGSGCSVKQAEVEQRRGTWE